MDESDCALTRADPELISRYIQRHTHKHERSLSQLDETGSFSKWAGKLAWAGLGSYRVRAKPNQFLRWHDRWVNLQVVRRDDQLVKFWIFATLTPSLYMRMHMVRIYFLGNRAT